MSDSTLKLEQLTRATDFATGDDVIINRDLGAGNFGNRKVSRGVVMLAIQLIGTWDAAVTYQPNHAVVAGDGNYYRAKSITINGDPTIDDGSFWEIIEVRNSITLNVPSRFDVLADAWSFLKNAIIGEAATVTIQFANGTHTFETRQVLNHTFGDKIRILGNVSTPASCVLDASGIEYISGTYVAEADGLICVSKGNTLGLLDGFTMTGPGRDQTGLAAILALNGATINCGLKMIVRDFYFCVGSFNHSVVVCNGIIVSGGGDGNLFAYNHSTIVAQNCDSSGADVYFAKAGAMIEHGSALWAPGGNFHGNAGAQVALHFSSTAMLNGATVNGAFGIEASWLCSLDVSGVGYLGGAGRVDGHIENGKSPTGRLFKFGLITPYAEASKFDFITDGLATMALIQNNLLAAIWGYGDGSTEFELSNTAPGALIRMRVGAAGFGSGGTVAAEFTAKGFSPPRLTGDPSGPSEGFLYYNTTSHHWRGWNGSAWVQLDN